MKKKILIVASSRVHILNFHLPYIRAFQDMGCEVHVGCRDAAAGIPGADRSIELGFEKSMSSLSNFALALRIRNLIRAEGYGLVICHTSLAAFFTRLALLGMGSRPKLCNVVHGFLFDENSSMLKKLVLGGAEKLTAGVTDLMVLMNRWDEAYAKKHSLAKKLAFTHGVGLDTGKFGTSPGDVSELRRELMGGADGFLLIYAAEFSKRKSQSTLIKAMAELPENFFLLLPGDGALRQECIDLSESLGLSKRVLFPGYVKDVGRYYAAADAAVSSSRSEGLPFNILEAMQLGLPVAASNVKGHNDLIKDGVSGLLFPYGDSEECAKCIRKLHDDSKFAAGLSENARLQLENYSLEKVLPELMRLYLSIM